MTKAAFPTLLYVTLERDEDESETLRAAFDPEDCSGEIAVYELKSLGRNESRFVEDDNRHTLEQQRRFVEAGQ
jgi:hypothetical protein